MHVPVRALGWARTHQQSAGPRRPGRHPLLRRAAAAPTATATVQSCCGGPRRSPGAAKPAIKQQPNMQIGTCIHAHKHACIQACCLQAAAACRGSRVLLVATCSQWAMPWLPAAPWWACAAMGRCRVHHSCVYAAAHAQVHRMRPNTSIWALHHARSSVLANTHGHAARGSRGARPTPTGPVEACIRTRCTTPMYLTGRTAAPAAPARLQVPPRSRRAPGCTPTLLCWAPRTPATTSSTHAGSSATAVHTGAHTRSTLQMRTMVQHPPVQRMPNGRHN